MNLDPDSVIEANLHLSQIDPDDFFVWYNLARAYELKGLFQQALQSYHRAVDLRPDDFYALYALAELFWKLQRLDEAALCFRKIVSLHPENHLGHYGLGRIHARAKEWQIAIRRLKRAVEIEPSEDRAWALLGQVYYESSLLQEAILALEAATSKNPENFNYHFLYGFYLFQALRHEDASVSFRKAIRLNEEDVRSRFWLASCLYHQRKNTQAALCLEKTLQIEPNHLDSLRLFSRIFIESRDFERARTMLDRVVQIDPFHEGVDRDFFEIFVYTKNWERAAFFFKKLNLQELEEQKDETFLLLLSQYYHFCKQSQKALEILDQLLKKRFYREEIFCKKSLFLLDLGKIPEAGKVLSDGLDLYPDSVMLLEMMADFEDRCARDIEALAYRKRAQEAERSRLSKGSEPEGDGEAKISFLCNWQEIKSQKEARNIEFQRKIASSSQQEEIYFLHGDWLCENGYLDEADACIRMGKAACKSSERNFDFRLAEIARQRENFEEALQICQNLIKSSEQVDAELVIFTVRIALQKGDFEFARELLLQYRLKDPKNPLFLIYLLKLARFEGNYTEMKVLCDALLQMDPENIAGLFARGLVCLRAEEIDTASKCFSKVIEKTSRSDRESWYYLGITCKIRGDVKGAFECFKEVIRIEPEDVYALYHLGLILKSRGHYQEALKYLHKVISLDPQDIYTRQHLGILYFEQQDYERCAREMMEVIRRFPEDRLGNQYLGQSFLKMNRYHKAVQAFERALRQERKDASLWFYLAQACEGAQKYKDAILAAQKALSLADKGSSVYAFSQEILQKLQSDYPAE